MSTEPESRVVLLILDGLRPDSIDPQRTPGLQALRERGCLFSNARTVFPSMTRTATASLSTGATPARHGVVGNAFYVPEANRERVIDFDSMATIRAFEERSKTPLVCVETFADRLADAGLSMAMVHAGGAASAHLLVPRAAEQDHWVCALSAAGEAQQPPELVEVVERFGPLPERTIPDVASTHYAARVFVDHVLDQIRPRLAVLWLNEPDKTWHFRGFASEDSDAALTAADAAVGRVLDWLDAQPDRDAYTLVLTSDHGHATVSEEIELYDLLSGHGHACRHMIHGDLGKDPLAVTGWTYGAISVRDDDPGRLKAVAAWLQEQDYIGGLFSNGENGSAEGMIPGTLSLEIAGTAHPRQAELLFTTMVRDDLTAVGLTGVGPSIGGRTPPRRTMHGGLSRAELCHTLIVQGPGFTAGVEDGRAAGIIDIAPTVLAILGVEAGTEMIGQALSEPAAESHRQVYEVSNGNYHQSLQVVTSGRARYLQAGGRI